LLFANHNAARESQRNLDCVFTQNH
jgi:hypothetical protein